MKTIRLNLFTFLLMLSSVGWGQTDLEPSDVIIVGKDTFNSQKNIAIMLLVNIEVGTEIKLTDRGWTSGANFWTTGTADEITCTFTAAEPLTAGTIIYGTEFSGFGTGAFLDGQNDQIFLYQDSPNFDFLFGVYYKQNGGLVWDSNATDAATSAIPSGLTNNQNALVIDKDKVQVSSAALQEGQTVSEILADVAGSWADYKGNDQTLVEIIQDIVGADDRIVIPGATPKYWDGSKDSNWSDTENWEGGVVPASNQAAYIPSGCTNYPVINASSGDVTCEELIIISGGTVTIADGYKLTASVSLINEGTISVEDGGQYYSSGRVAGAGTFNMSRFMDAASGYQYHYASSPVESADIGVFSGAWKTFEYQEPLANNSLNNNSAWVEAGSISRGYGYAPAWLSSNTVTFTGGKFNTGSITGEVTVTRTEANAHQFIGFNLVGNPYPCNIDPETFLTENASVIDGGVRIWMDDKSGGSNYNTADYQYWSSGGTVEDSDGQTALASGYKIAACQGFFVKVKSGVTSGDVKFYDNMKTTTSTTFYKKNETQIQRIKFAIKGLNGDKTQYNQTLLAFAADATFGIDQKYDIEKAILEQTPIALYSYTEEGILAIQGLPKVTDASARNYTIPLGINSKVTGTFNLEVIEFLNLVGNYTIVLKDKDTDQEYTITDGLSFNFDLSETGVSNRFEVEIKQNTVIWTGNSGTSWSDPTNWSSGTVPTELENVLIPAGLGTYPIITNTTACKGLLIEKNASLEIAAEGTLAVSGNIDNFAGADGLLLRASSTASAQIIFTDQKTEATVEHYISNEPQLFAFTVRNSSITSVDVPNSSDFTIKEFVESSTLSGENDWSNNWHTINIQQASTFDSNYAYLVSSVTPQTISVKGEIFIGRKYFSPIRKTTTGADGWNLLANPHPFDLKRTNAGWFFSDFNWLDTWVPVYVKKDGNYRVHNGRIGTLENDGLIKRGEGFFVKPHRDLSSIELLYDLNTEHKKSEETLAQLNLSVSGASTADLAQISLSAEATEEFNTEFDIDKLFGDNNAPQLYFPITDHDLSTKGLPVDFDQSIPFNVVLPNTESTFMLEIAKANWPENRDVTIEDMQTGEFMPLTDDYSKVLAQAGSTLQYVLHFSKKATGTKALERKTTEIFEAEGILHINLAKEPTQAILTVYNLAGAKLVEKELKAKQNAFDLNLPEGMYMVGVLQGGETVSERIFLK